MSRSKRVEASPEFEAYMSCIQRQLESVYEVAQKARSIGLDPALEPEPCLVSDLAGMVEGLVGPKGVASRIKELISLKKDKYEMAFVVASDILYAKYGHTEPETAAEQAIRTALAIMTGGITAAPIQGIARVRKKQNLDGSNYLAIYYAGPMRSAGGTEQALTLVVGDYVRRIIGWGRYKPTRDEIKRFIEEVRLCEREVTRFQYHVSDKDLEFVLQNLPVEPTGTETDPVEVSSYRNLPRIETNRIRGGCLRVVNDGVVGRAQKVLKIVEENRIQGWEWLSQLRQDTRESQNMPASHMEDVIAGRPIFSFPGRPGGFRLRYGRSRNTGLAALGLHPATMAILHGFLASGTQIRIDGPGKGGIVVPVDTLEGPIVKLLDGAVRRVESYEEALSIRDKVVKILFLGDLLVAFGEFLENNKPLVPAGYTEEWWALDLANSIKVLYGGSVKSAAHSLEIEESRIQALLHSPLTCKPTATEAISLSVKLGLPLHPRFSYAWQDISLEEIKLLRDECIRAFEQNVTASSEPFMLNLTQQLTDILDRLCIPYEIQGAHIIFGEDGYILKSLLRPDRRDMGLPNEQKILDYIRLLSNIIVKEKYLSTVGARMGRPEKARKREMSPPVHTLFPVGLAGGSHRSIILASQEGIVRVEVNRRKCQQCGQLTYKRICPVCNSQTAQENICPRCSRTTNEAVCPVCGVPVLGWSSFEIDMRGELSMAMERVGHPKVDEVKGVRGLTSTCKVPELIEKGLLRAKHGVSVFKDGTIRFDATNAPLTHFIPNEIGVSVEKLYTLGYTHDMYGYELADPMQMCELKVQDVILPYAAAEHFLSVSRFVDELLEKLYHLPPFYNAKSIEDLIGHLVLGFAPHTSAAVVGRIIGFSKANVCYAHPLWHNIKRRDCDGDEDSLMLLLDVLLNFSKSYLPAQIGGMMDAPLLIISTVDPFEVDEAQNMDVAEIYPREFYEKTLNREDPKLVCSIIDTIQSRLGTPSQFERYRFTHLTFDINEGNLVSSYMGLGSMANKLAAQLRLAEMIRAVDSKEVARRVLVTHLIQDIMGNLRAYVGQKLRCKKCNTKYRRVPLSGSCWQCGGQLQLTVHRKGVEKYLGLAQSIVKKYDLDVYYSQRVGLLQNEVECLFGKNGESTVSKVTVTLAKGKQVKLADFM
ncbi:MAG: DNA polymerase II large subunit [Candidatus Bathyarchaeia archaeon]